MTIEDLKQYQDRLSELEAFIKVDEAKASIPDIQTRILRRKLDFNSTFCSVYLCHLLAYQNVAWLACLVVLPRIDRTSSVFSLCFAYLPLSLSSLFSRTIDNLMDELMQTTKSISPELAPVHRRLVQLKIELDTLASRSTWTSSEVHHIQEELREIEAKRIDGKFCDKEGNVVSGQAAVIGLLEDCYDDCHNLLATKEQVPKPLQDIFKRLQVIKTELERLVLTQRWTLRETDLWQYEIQLSEISGLRKNGKFVDREGNVQEGQVTYLIRHSYELFCHIALL